jgi:uncharacterized repeat protein (TIGR03803 family)
MLRVKKGFQMQTLRHTIVTRAYGVVVLYASAAVALHAQTLTTLHSFDQTDGALPYAGLVQASNGHLYGTTNAGGVGEGNSGTIFEMTPQRYTGDARQPRRSRLPACRRAGPNQWRGLVLHNV